MEQTFFSVKSACIHIRVKAKPGAREDSVLGVRGSELLVAVRVPPEKGRANAEIAKVLAQALDVPHNEIVLKLGGASVHKVYSVPLDAATALGRIAGET